jgi:hypothetical protein
MADPKVPISSGPDEPSSKELDADSTKDTSKAQGNPSPQDSAMRQAWRWVVGKHDHIRDWLIAAFTCALMVATFFYVYYAKQQRDAMIAQTEAMNRPLLKRERVPMLRRVLLRLPLTVWYWPNDLG